MFSLDRAELLEKLSQAIAILMTNNIISVSEAREMLKHAGFLEEKES